MESSKVCDETLTELEQDFGDKAPVVTDAPEAKPSKAAELIRLIENAELFCDDAGEPYVSFINDKGHKETWPIKSGYFENILSSLYWQRHKKVVSKNNIQDALAAIAGKARFEGKRQKVFLRVAKLNDAIYIDLVNKSWEVLEVTASGWRILQDAPVKFRRTDNMMPLPSPNAGGDINALWRFLNVSEQARLLILSFILESFRADTPFAILVLHGLQGSAKSSTQKIIRMLIDPAISNLRCAPKKADDILIAAANNWLVSFNNISHLSDAQQDDLCSIATGGGYATRQLYTNGNEFVADVQRPIIMNGIDNFVTAQDLIDRCLVIESPIITNKDRKSEQEIFAAFDQEYPNIFGVILDILVATLKQLPNVNLVDKPRMADFAILGTALEMALGYKEGAFMEAYQANRKENMLTAMEHSPVILAVIKYMESCQRYEGTFAKLYSLLSDYKPSSGGWVQSPKGLASQIKKHVYALKLIGLNVEFHGRREGGYYVCLYKDLFSNVQ